VEEAMNKTVLAKLAAMDALARVTSLNAKRSAPS